MFFKFRYSGAWSFPALLFPVANSTIEAAAIDLHFIEPSFQFALGLDFHANAPPDRHIHLGNSGSGPLYFRALSETEAVQRPSSDDLLQNPGGF